MDINYKDLREQEYDYCRENLEYFVKTYGHIEDKDADTLVQPFVLWPEQEKALENFRDHKLNVILKSPSVRYHMACFTLCIMEDVKAWAHSYRSFSYRR